MLMRAPSGILNLNLVALELKTSKRRVYDVTNVLEGIHLIKKKSKNLIEWLGPPANITDDKELIEKEKRLDTLIRTCTKQIHRMFEDTDIQRFVYLTYEDVRKMSSLKEQTVIVIRAPAGTKLEVPHPDESFQVHLKSTQGPIEVFICSDDPLLSQGTEASVAKSSHLNLSNDGKDCVSNSPSLMQMSYEDDASSTSGISSICNSLSNPKQHSSLVTVSPIPPSLTSLQPPSEDQQSFVTLTSPQALSLDGERYLLSPAENEGISDLFSVDLEQVPVDLPVT